MIEYNNEEQTSVVVRVNGVAVRFGCHCSDCQCQRVWIKLSDLHKNTQCGLCGHYDNKISDEWRMSNNELTDDLAKFHRSFSIVKNNDEECTESTQSDFYSKNKNQFRVVDNEFLIKDNTNDVSVEYEQQNFGGYLQENVNSEEWTDDLYKTSQQQQQQQTKGKHNLKTFKLN